MVIMSYQVLARKWRPKSFSEVVGQQHVLKILSNALSLGRVHHAYLFSGTRGVGKTSIARLLAKGLNCETGITATPCGECDNCRDIELGRFVDLLEIDAASRTKVEDTREILDNIQYLPTKGRFKVYLIDEVHMLSRSSFNALLKTLEEPPENTYFILSDEHNSHLLPTIHSRCFSYFLSLPKLEQSIEWLKKRHCQQSNDNELASALLLSENAPLAALALLKPEKWQQRKAFCDRLLRVVPHNDYWQLAKTFDNEEFIECIIWFCALLSDALKAKQKAGRFIVNRDQVPLVRLLATKSNEKISALYELWLQARRLLLSVTGLNKELIVYNVLAQSEIISD